MGLLEAERVGGWFTFKLGGSSAQTFNVRLASLRGTCEYWRAQEWLVGDPALRLVPRRVPPDHSKAMTRDEVTGLLAKDASLRERVLWTMLYETAARADELLLLDIPDLNTANRCETVTRKGRGQGCGRLADRDRAAAAASVSRPQARAGVPD
ncbi:hypothetical protein [Rhodococcus sp. B10]|uniref:hypothetical protein n=1 Tax=Rhodococcus sp. B10 TaxID=2695876 RepID=UPI001F0D9054|nr:hypothetical protein [Rhodococcus sp. B10]